MMYYASVNLVFGSLPCLKQRYKKYLVVYWCRYAKLSSVRYTSYMNHIETDHPDMGMNRSGDRLYANGNVDGHNVQYTATRNLWVPPELQYSLSEESPAYTLRTNRTIDARIPQYDQAIPQQGLAEPELELAQVGELFNQGQYLLRMYTEEMQGIDPYVQQLMCYLCYRGSQVLVSRFEPYPDNALPFATTTWRPINAPTMCHLMLPEGLIIPPIGRDDRGDISGHESSQTPNITWQIVVEDLYRRQEFERFD